MYGCKGFGDEYEWSEVSFTSEHYFNQGELYPSLNRIKFYTYFMATHTVKLLFWSAKKIWETVARGQR